jgi:hypothetical protein
MQLYQEKAEHERKVNVEEPSKTISGPSILHFVNQLKVSDYSSKEKVKREAKWLTVGLSLY